MSLVGSRVRNSALTVDDLPTSESRPRRKPTAARRAVLKELREFMELFRVCRRCRRNVCRVVRSTQFPAALSAAPAAGSPAQLADIGCAASVFRHVRELRHSAAGRRQAAGQGDAGEGGEPLPGRLAQRRQGARPDAEQYLLQRFAYRRRQFPWDRSGGARRIPFSCSRYSERRGRCRGRTPVARLDPGRHATPATQSLSSSGIATVCSFT